MIYYDQYDFNFDFEIIVKQRIHREIILEKVSPHIQTAMSTTVILEMDCVKETALTPIIQKQDQMMKIETDILANGKIT